MIIDPLSCNPRLHEPDDLLGGDVCACVRGGQRPAGAAQSAGLRPARRGVRTGLRLSQTLPPTLGRSAP